MDESDRIGATVIQTPRRNVRRKLVQSTLLPHKSDDEMEPRGDRKCDAGEKEEGEGGDAGIEHATPEKREEEDEGGGGDGGSCSSQGKKTSKQRTPKKNGASNDKMAKGKSPGKSTPKKNATKNGTLAADDHMNVSPSLPNLRLEAKLRAENWTFTEQTSTTWSPHQPIKSDPLTHRLKEFDLNELPALSHPDASDKAEVVDGEAHQAVNLSNRVGGAADISHELQSISCRESGQPCNSLGASEFLQVCGSTDSVKLMNEWLGQWHERGFQPSKDFLSSDEEKSQDADYKCSESDSDSENTGAEDRLKNVLLIVGPVGSGKSAAIHACAKEQGFKILESNASECRSGAVVRQKFGEALKSYSLSRSLEPLFHSCTDGNGVEDVIERYLCSIRPLLHLQNDRANLKPLILFEDVDISFAEDRGLVSAIQQIVEKAKGNVVLTANDKNHGLPDNLERIEVGFSLPSTKELFTHLSSVCTAEEVKVYPGLLEQLAIFCGGDIRKAIMQLQFWFQSKFNGARKAKNTANPYSFDHEAGQTLLPKIITHDFPSQLSQYRRVIGNKLLSVSQSVDVSCVPESSYVPETLMDSEAELSPRAVSCGHFDGRVEVTMSEDVAQLKEIYIDRFFRVSIASRTRETNAESSDGTMMMEDCFKEYVGSSQKMRQVIDECSRIDFGTIFKTAKKTKHDTVQESWKKLCSSHTDMKPYLDSEPVAMEPTMNVSGDLDTSGYVLEQMTSIVAEQGFSFFTNQIATTVSFPTLSATMVLVVDETKKDHTWSGGSCLDMKPETHLDVLKCERMVLLSSVLESVVPLRSLRGRAFHEYASFIGQISRANPSNLSGVMENSRRQRSRESRHYLSMDLSSEDICMLGSTKHISKR
ncbi:BnaCnng11360D [Brassica napus]|uniref:BnaCnng11360D protein n=1 Tax=Brassica napus TaxID=3708 RepID=A0A078I129_BRANA|nr:BnaCnng11360D [Brassica napus]